MSEAVTIFADVALVLLIATILAGIARKVHQPIMLAYIVTGIVAGPMLLGLTSAQEILGALSGFGIAFLLFIVGLNLDFKILKQVGAAAVGTGLGQVLFTSIFGFLGSHYLLGFGFTESIYIAIAISFSSTIIIVKLLTDKGELDTLYGRISIGFLIVQDIIAVFVLFFFSASASGLPLEQLLIQTIGQGIIALLVLFGVANYLLPKILPYIARSQEWLFLFAIAWLFIVAAIFGIIGFSVEIGALLAGLTLAPTVYHYEISSRLKPVKDFFIIIFFIVLGANFVFTSAGNIIVPALIFSAFVLFGNPLIVMTIMGLEGYSRRTGFLAGLTVAQISEFSLIIISLGLTLGAVTQEIASMITLVAVITITGSTYMILYGNQLYQKLSPILQKFERKELKRAPKSSHEEGKVYPIIQFGHGYVGEAVYESLNKLKKEVLVIDFNPEVIEELTKQGTNTRFGDANDVELLEALKLNKVQMIVSTVPDQNTSELLLEEIRKVNKKAIVIMTALDIDEALNLYKDGANYIILPTHLTGEHASFIIEKFKLDGKKFIKAKADHIKKLKQKKKHSLKWHKIKLI